jgi:signal transduction histidine kinase
MAAHAESVGVTVRCAADGTAEVVGSEAALRRALTSLVDNALAHEHAGGTIELRVRRDPRHVSVAVIDDGVGIDAETQSTLFTRFAHGDAHSGPGGREPYGIGLALVREVAHAHGGDISVESTPGHGATFTLTLPAASD